LSGLVGIYTVHPRGQEEKTEVVRCMANHVSYCQDDLIEIWHDEYLGVGRVHRRIVNSETQPLFSEDHTLCIWMAGEIFGYEAEKKALIARGHRFLYENNDAEYCLHLYEEIGERAFEQLNGSFAIVIYDLSTRDLSLVTDHVGSWGLFYACDDKQLAFGSQLRPLLEIEGVPHKLDLQAVFEFFTFQQLLGDRTYYKAVRTVPPGTVLNYKDGKVTLERYWQLQFRPEEKPERYYIEALADAFKKAVLMRTRGEHRFSVLLSGGLDSRCLLAADKLGKIRHALTVGDIDNREVRLARRIAGVEGRNHTFLRRDEDYYARIVDQAVEIADGMDRFDHGHFLGFIPEIQDDADVVLHGCGLDGICKGNHLLLAGLNVAGVRIDVPVLRRVSMRTPADTVMDSSSYHRRRESVFGPSLWSVYSEGIGASIHEVLQREDAFDSSLESVGQYFAIANTAYKHHSALNVLCLRPFVEERTVATDTALLEWYQKVPPRYKVAGRIFKKAMRMIAPELLSIPDSNTWLRPSVSVWADCMAKQIRSVLGIARRKIWTSRYGTFTTQSSWPNMDELVRQNTKLQRLIKVTINDPEALDPTIFDIATANRAFQEHIGRSRNAHDLLFLLLTFGRWFKKHGPK